MVSYQTRITTIYTSHVLSGLGQLPEVDWRCVLGRAVVECLGREKTGPLGRVVAIPEESGRQFPSASSRPLPQHAPAMSVYPDACGSTKVSRESP